MYSPVRTLCVLLVASFTALAQDAPPIEDVFTASPEQLLAQAKAMEAEEDDSVVVLLREFTFNVESDGSGRSTYKLIYQIRKEDAVDGWGAVSSTWAPWRQTQPRIRARVIAPDGTVHELDPATITEVAGRNAANSIYSDDKKLQAPLPAIEVGSVVEREIVVDRLKPAFDGGTAGKWYFDTSGPTRIARMIIDAAQDVPLHYFVQIAEDAGPEVTEADGRKRLVFELRDLPADADAPSHLPSDRPRWPAVVYSTGESWQAVAARYGERLEEQLAAGPIEKVDVPEGLSKKELAAALKAKLHEQVRYTGIEFGESAYIPHPPSETMGRRYGDCKDTATVLIGMLRSHGVDATIALLNAGTGRDVDPETPGMGRFNHAIVYVPDDKEPLWIDTTAEFSRVDELPTGDQGRLALIVDPATTELTLTPESTSADNRLVKHREVTLPNDGKGTLTEVFESYGSIELGYRGSFHGVTSDEDLRASFEGYAQDEFASEEIETIEVSASDDLSSRYRMRIELSEAGRAVGDPNEAVVVVPLSGLLARIPSALLSDPEEDEEKRTDDFVFSNPHTVEYRYRIKPALGYEPRELPEEVDRTLGAARFTTTYATGEDGALEAVLKLDSGPRRLTAEEFEETREALREFRDEDRVLLWFDQRGQTLMTAGKVAEALAEFRSLSQAEPDEVLHRVRTAGALLAAGLGEPARAEARAATEADPESVSAWMRLGWVLEHDLVGRRFAKGYDPAGAEAAYRKAIELDGELVNPHAALGILLEHVPRGERYGRHARLDEAIEAYRKVLEIEENQTFQQNLFLALLYAGQFEELKEALKDSGRTDLPHLEVVWRTMLESPDAAIAWANRNISDDARIKQLDAAQQYLSRTRHYPEAAAVIRGLAAGSGGNAQALARARLLDSMKRYEEVEVPADKPLSACFRFLRETMDGDGDLEAVLDTLSRHARTRTLSDEETMDELRQTMHRSVANARVQGIPPAVGLDVVFANQDIPISGSDATGYHTVMQVSDQRLSLFIVHEEGEYRLLDASDGSGYGKFPDIGLEALARIENDDLEGAGYVLDWAAKQLPANEGDDPLEGNVFAKFWSEGAERDAKAMRLAAAVLLADHRTTAERALAILEPARKKAPKRDRLAFDIAIYAANDLLERLEATAEASRILWKAAPESDIALFQLSAALGDIGAWEEFERAIASRLSKDKNNLQALKIRLFMGALRGDFETVAATKAQLDLDGELTSVELDMEAWGDLAWDRVDEDTLKVIERSIRLSGDNTSVETLKRVAAIYAETGQVGPARQVQLQAMQSEALEEPDDSAWFVFGRLAEHLGETETARSYYQRIEEPDDELFRNLTYYGLAQRRLAKL